MHYENYYPLHVSSDAFEYKFYSNGPNGKICIVIQFVTTDSPDVYNLAFGNLLPDGDIDDLVKNNNSDRNKVLATVAAAVYEFTSVYPQKHIYFTGSTPERTRLYRMALTLNLQVLSRDFDIHGVMLKNNAFYVESFLKGVNYHGFLVKRKID